MELLKGNIFYIPISEIKMAHLKNTNIQKKELLQLVIQAITAVDPKVITGMDLTHDGDK